MIPYWVGAIVISVGGFCFLASRSEGGSYDMTPLLWVPLGCFWFTLTWVVYAGWFA